MFFIVSISIRWHKEKTKMSQLILDMQFCIIVLQLSRAQLISIIAAAKTSQKPPHKCWCPRRSSLVTIKSIYIRGVRTYSGTILDAIPCKRDFYILRKMCVCECIHVWRSIHFSSHTTTAARVRPKCNKTHYTKSWGLGKGTIERLATNLLYIGWRELVQSIQTYHERTKIFLSGPFLFLCCNKKIDDAAAADAGDGGVLHIGEKRIACGVRRY